MKYRALAAKVGVSLASDGNRAKAFGPSTVGEVLGLDYDTERWKNWIPETGLQVHWWIFNLRALRQKGGKIKDPKINLPARALGLHEDAAGGDTYKV